MPGIHVTDRQVRRYMSSRKDGYSQAAATARAGFSERTGRRIEAKPVLPSQREGRRYRTRPDPFAEVWRDERFCRKSGKGRESSRCPVPLSCSEQVKLLRE